ncbi:hypothetical protein [Rhizobium lusitanum]|uniref:Uncharacterized protein n=1 Tax=Rhizobium lusitanum TaxID=293958 RepID=A0A7X0IU19_9HYPH|nr:hypothetical protein [Rhizobium lusitanum]MBB6486854.1 hypothetical protein [Rhizobium lusitanum]
MSFKTDEVIPNETDRGLLRRNAEVGGAIPTFGGTRRRATLAHHWMINVLSKEWSLAHWRNSCGFLRCRSAGGMVSSKRLAGLGHCIFYICLCVTQNLAFGNDFSGSIPPGIVGPSVYRADIVQELDCGKSLILCNGPLNFVSFMNAKAATRGAERNSNPFNLRIARLVLQTVTQQIDTVRKDGGADSGMQMDLRFLSHPDSKAELVGVINRMDRQFIKDAGSGLTDEQQSCGEIAIIYRFGYNLRDGAQKSRLPITMNLVFPALPKGSKVSCREIARRWVAYMADESAGRKWTADMLLDPATGPLALINGSDLLRLELNIQAYRFAAGDTEHAHGFGSQAKYLMRVFQWVPKHQVFEPLLLTNEIDRSHLLCSQTDGSAACVEKSRLRDKLVAYLQRPAVVASIDRGTLNIPSEFLSYSATSISPGGDVRSENQLFWNATSPSQQIISDDEIKIALDGFAATGQQTSFIKSPDDFRARLNESACTGCHQTRAIAGFHFPGQDRDDTPRENAVALAGSPLFYGDQPRRRKIVTLMAARPNAKLNEYELAASYSSRPLNSFVAELEGTQLLGGWGGACVVPNALSSTQRQWLCQPHLECKQLFKTPNEPIVGTCVPEGERKQVGDPLQVGIVATKAFGIDSYQRTAPSGPTTLIPANVLPKDAPDGNSYYGAHQEYYEGLKHPTTRDEIRDQQTGGFPAGMLRLSECIGLPDEASCGLVASTGFNDCVERIGNASSDNTTLAQCFSTFTSLAGLRACDAASPCRDDYICVKPMADTGRDALLKFNERARLLDHSAFFREVVNRDYDKAQYYGQTRPDGKWMMRNDRRGVCIPPYFVFQFRSDKHPRP